MLKTAKNIMETMSFIFLTLSLYFVFWVTLPVFKESHGLLVMSDLTEFSSGRVFFGFLFGSVCVCVLLGVFILNWIPSFSPGVMGNFWATTYFFLWVDSVFFLSLQSHSFKYIKPFGIGILFIYLFFFALNYFETAYKKNEMIETWKSKMVHYWMWGWIGFYFGLSGVLAFQSMDGEGLRLPMAFGAMLVCFLNYLLLLFLNQTQGEGVDAVSKAGRAIFSLWAVALLVIWLAERWSA